MCGRGQLCLRYLYHVSKHQVFSSNRRPRCLTHYSFFPNSALHVEAKKKPVWLKTKLFPCWSLGRAIPGRDRRWCSNSTRGTTISDHTSNGSVTVKVKIKNPQPTSQPTNQAQERKQTGTQPRGKSFHYQSFKFAIHPNVLNLGV